MRLPVLLPALLTLLSSAAARPPSEESTAAAPLYPLSPRSPGPSGPDADADADAESPGRLRARQPGSELANLEMPQQFKSATSLLARLNTDGPQRWLRRLTEFPNRDHRSKHGILAGKWLQDKLEVIASANPAIKVTAVDHTPVSNQQSIIVTIPGHLSGPTVIVATHYDATSGRQEGSAEGADISGSAVVTHMEVLRVLAEHKFKTQNTIEFHFYAGRRAKHFGERAIMNRYSKEKRQIVAVLDQTRAGNHIVSRSIYTCLEHSDPGLVTFADRVTKYYVGFKPERVQHCAGNHHIAWYHGFPTLHITGRREDPEDSDTHEDLYQYINWFSILRHSILTLAFVVEAGNGY
ncbi:hypothetical protein PZA11_007414 [Diplocarpon coronariae]